MKKRNVKVIAIISVIILAVVYFRFTSLKFDLDVKDVYSIEYSFDNCNNGNYDRINGEVTDKDQISKIVKYFNSISLVRTPEKPKDATQCISFKNNEGNVIEGYAFGASVLWDWNKTYVFGDYYQDKIKKLLSIDK